jgi:hypothetical protein
MPATRRGWRRTCKILVVEYPSPSAFIDMVTNENFMKLHEYRADALDRGDLIATSWTMAD